MAAIVINGSTPVIGASDIGDPKYFNISRFRSNIGNSYHRTVHYNMLVPCPTGLLNAVTYQSTDNANFKDAPSRLFFDIEKTSMPGILLATDEIRRYGIGYMDRKPYVPDFEQLEVTVRSDGSGQNYDFFQSWIKLIINYDTQGNMNSNYGLGSVDTTGKSVGAYEVNYRDDYAVNATIVAYNEDGNTAIETTMIKFFPIYLGEIQYDWSDTNQIVKFQVKFTFSEWTQSRKYVSSLGTTNNPTATTATPSQTNTITA